MAGYLQVIVGNLIAASYGTLVRSLTYDGYTLTFFLFFFGSFALGFLLWRENNRKNFFALVREPRYVGTALINVISWILYTWAFRLATVGPVVFLSYTYPVMVAVLAPLVLKEHVHRRTVWAIVSCLIGVALMVNPKLQPTNPETWLGYVLALISGLTFGLWMVLSKLIPRQLLGMEYNLVQCLLGSLVLIPWSMTALTSLVPPTLIKLVGLATVQMGLAVSLNILGLAKIKAQHAALLSYLHPVAATFYARIFLGEVLSPINYLGGGIILAATLSLLGPSNTRT